MDFRSLFIRAVEARASDIHLRSGRKPVLRVNGPLVRVGTAPIVAGALHDQITQMVPGRDAR